MTHHITTSCIRLRPITFVLKTIVFLANPSRDLLDLRYLGTFLILASLIVICQPGYCEPPKTRAWIVRQINDTMEIKIPNDFKPEGVDEPHIFKWTKDSAEIYIVIGDRLVGSRTTMINALKKSAAADKTVDQVRILRIPNAKGIILKEKTPSAADRLMYWNLKIFSDKREINVELSAPGKDFKTYSPVFEDVVKSIKVVKSP